MSDKARALSIREKLSQAPQSEPDSRFIALLLDRYRAVNGLTEAYGKDLSAISEFSDEDFKGGPEALGRLYQLYLSPEKDEAFALLSRGERLEKRQIPPATQIFTPRWIALYMAQNGIGRAARDIGIISGEAFERLKMKWPYFIDDGRVSGGENPRGRSIENLKIIDPCAGAGNLLLAAFDVLRDIYLEIGFAEKDAALSILENNLYGLDIDKNVLYIAAFALRAKACESGLPLSRVPEPRNLVHIDSDDGVGSLKRDGAGGVLSAEYDVVLANPPYMGNANMPSGLAKYINKNYPDGKSDLFAAFIIRCRELTRAGGYTAIITQHAWMFLKSFLNLRLSLLKDEIVNMLHLGSRAFDEIGGEVVSTASFVLRASAFKGGKSVFVRLTEERCGADKERAFLAGEGRFVISQRAFSSIPGCPLSYWASPGAIAAFFNPPLKRFAAPRQGLATGDNGRFTRLWHEVAREDICFNASSRSAALESGKRWFPYNKGGKYRKWYGNDEYVVDWANDGYEIRNNFGENGKLRSRPQSLDRFFKPSVTWSKVSSNDIAFRYKPGGFIFDVSGTSMFADGETLMYLLAFCNSRAALEISRLISPTMNFEVGQIASFPVIMDESAPEIAALAERCVQISREDWDDFETSWDFKIHPMLAYSISGGFGDGKVYAETSFGLWKLKTEERAGELKSLEDQINRRFAAIYGMDYAKTEANVKSLTVRRVADAVPGDRRKTRFALDRRDAAVSLISYAVGCAFNRFTPFGEGFSSPSLLISIQAFPRENDAVDTLKRFLAAAYGAETLAENLRFLALSLSNGADGTDKPLYAYFYKRFVDDHIKTYRGLPIYWLFDDGDFKALVYMFGFDETTVKRVAALRKSAGREPSPYSRALSLAASFPPFDFNDGVMKNYSLFQGIKTIDRLGRTVYADLLYDLGKAR